MGAGAVGQLACAASKVQGAAHVAAIDVDSDRLEFAKKSGWADAIFTLPRVPIGTQFASSDTSGMDEVQGRRAQRAQEDQDGMSAAKARAAEALQHFENDEAKIQAGFDVVLECTGVPSCVALSIFMARPGAKIGLIGMGAFETLRNGKSADGRGVIKVIIENANPK
ncbi:hypothetical protein CBOM_00514 [Ceraceosorus bombacis]|uniref:Uncharacterized protein n=1 Tax=Ceraceosorus bombacis TaxID=401625 RepID=A0A0P1BBJ8_9BASI|nr:hypothetical protein CBOM_00514 [Ceraceosorus bombacis]